jgi:hypothetical protein
MEKLKFRIRRRCKSRLKDNRNVKSNDAERNTQEERKQIQNKKKVRGTLSLKR